MHKKKGTKSRKSRFATGKEMGGHILGWKWRTGDVSYEEAVAKWHRFTNIPVLD